MLNVGIRKYRQTQKEEKKTIYSKYVKKTRGNLAQDRKKTRHKVREEQGVEKRWIHVSEIN